MKRGKRRSPKHQTKERHSVAGGEKRTATASGAERRVVSGQAAFRKKMNERAIDQGKKRGRFKHLLCYEKRGEFK